ncbi:MAG: hypothetical protein QW275_00325 [Candidatus Anstonellaceae archaeon]
MRRKRARGWVEENYPYLFVLACYVVLAFSIGIHEPELGYQKIEVRQSWGEELENMRNASGAAVGKTIAIPMQRAERSVAEANVSGLGAVQEVSIDLSKTTNTSIHKLVVNGNLVCSPCNSEKIYPLQVEGDLEIYLEATNKSLEKERRDRSEGDYRSLDTYMKKNMSVSHTDMNIGIKFLGSWNAMETYFVPSSVYLIDAPFHINRIGILRDYIPRMQMPWAEYSFISHLPAGIFSALAGATPEYAFKFYLILLFFVPVIIFFVFSRKLSSGKKSSFLFASLLYLFMPVSGLINGGAADLFFYGMLPHTLATYFSLFFFLYAYSFLKERSRWELLFASVFFALALACNPRIVFPLGLIALFLGLVFLARKKFKETTLLAVSCALVSSFFTLPYAAKVFQDKTYLENYSPLGSVVIFSYLQAVFGVLQAGFVVLPSLFVLGVFFAYRQKEDFALILALSSIIVLAFATSPEINRAFPFVDGLRLLPSFFLPAFFIAGVGASKAYQSINTIIEKAPEKKQEIFRGAFFFAIMLPLASVLYVFVLTTTNQLREMITSPFIALEYASLREAVGIIGEERWAFEPEGLISQYPIYGMSINSPWNEGYENLEDRIRKMQEQRVRYIVMGAQKLAEGESLARNEEIKQMQTDERFEEVPLSGIFRLFYLKDGWIGRSTYIDFGKIEKEEIRYDQARVAGECLVEKCRVLIFSNIPKESKCVVSGKICPWIQINQTSATVEVERGSFDIHLAPSIGVLQIVLLAISLLGLSAPFLFWKKLEQL